MDQANSQFSAGQAAINANLAQQRVWDSVPVEPGDSSLNTNLRGALLKQLVYGYIDSDVFMASLIQASKFKPSDKQKTFSRILASQEHMQLCMTGIHISAPIPAHNHPFTFSMQLVLQGSARIRHYREVNAAPTGMVQLQLLSDRVLVDDDVTCICATKNIHSVEAVTQTVVMLTLQQTLCPEVTRSWYFPSAATTGNTTLWHRLKQHQKPRMRTDDENF